MDYLVSQQVLPPPPLPPHQWENRGECSVGENKHKGRFSGGDRPAFALFLSLVCVSWEKKKLWVESHRSDSKKLYLWYHLFSSPADGRGGFRKSRSGRDRRGWGGGVQEINRGGYTEALCDSAAPAPHHADGYNVHRQSRTEPGICVDALHKDLKWTSNWQVPWVRARYCVPLFRTQAVKPQAHVVPQQLIGTMWNHQKSLQPLLWIRISSLEVISIMADKVRPLELNHRFL